MAFRTFFVDVYPEPNLMLKFVYHLGKFCLHRRRQFVSQIAPLAIQKVMLEWLLNTIFVIRLRFFDIRFFSVFSDIFRSHLIISTCKSNFSASLVVSITAYKVKQNK
jgi:hypothetical protein